MQPLSDIYIRETLSDSALIYDRGKQTFENGSYFLSEKNLADQTFVYEFDGAFGQYTCRIHILDDRIEGSCNCPYPGKGCRHVVAAALNARSVVIKPRVQEELFPDTEDPYLSEAEIRDQALLDREDRARSDQFTPVRGDMFTGDHKVISRDSRTYTVCLHEPAKARGHCSCPDYLTNGLGTCKHIQFMAAHLREESGFSTQVRTETLPFIDIFWDSLAQAPRLYAPLLDGRMTDLKPVLGKYFDKEGVFTGTDISLIMGLMLRLHGDRRVRIRENLLKRVDHRLQALQLEKMTGRPLPAIRLSRPLYPYQEEGLAFGVLKTGVLIGDEMGLGKTAQAIALSLVKAEMFGFTKFLVITLASLKDQWKQEVESISGETACIIQGPPSRRRQQYAQKDRFKISHYEAVLRDVNAVSAYNPDIIILDEAQRIRNFSTKTAEAVKRLPKKHAIVLTGTPLENKPEELYSIVQFLDPYKFTPLWRFATDHFLIPRTRVTRIAGYKNLDRLRERIRDIYIRRTWEDVIDQLPETVTNNYYIDLAPEQQKRHGSYAGRLGEVLGKKMLTPMDMRQIHTLVLRMRMVANSTFLVDRETQVSPKLRELSTIIDEVVGQNRRKMVIFSEWTAMTFLIARHLSEAGIGFVEVSGKVTDGKRKALAQRFASAPDCRVFLTTDAGSIGLDLSAARCMVNVELPWTPALADQRRERLVPAPGTGEQDLPTCHIINLIGANSIEERILKGITRNPGLFTELFGADPEAMETLDRPATEMAGQLKALLGPELLPQETVGPEDIPEENPYFLFPEGMPTPDPEPEPPRDPASMAPVPGLAADPQKLEQVLTSGLDFITGLAEMATGQKLGDTGEKKISVDPETGEVRLTFRLPGF
ncbi:MAG: SNF2-related protein [Desulfobacter sp.]